MYAAIIEPSISPVVTSLFGIELMKKHTTDVYDVAFAMQCMSRQPIAREVIVNYIQEKIHKKFETISNEQIYIELEKILRQPVMQGRFQTREQPFRKIIVD